MTNKTPDNAYAIDGEAVCQLLQTDPSIGLNESEIKERSKIFGRNVIERQHKKPLVLILATQFVDPVILVLVVAASIGFLFGEIAEGIAVLAVILITVTIGFFMELQAMRSMEALWKLDISESILLRNGAEQIIEDSNIVPGDILILNSGDVVPADARILSQQSLSVKESSLTGESNQVEKSNVRLLENTVLADRKNMVYSGTMVTRGSGIAVVTSTGKYTEIGKIRRLTWEAKKQAPPLEKKLNGLSVQLIKLMLILAVFITLIGYLQGKDLKQMIETAMALAVAAIPEGLPIVATIALAKGMLRLAKDRAIIKNLSSVETLGGVGIICTDKTGTLTESSMTVNTILLQDSKVVISNGNESQSWKTQKRSDEFNKLVETGIFCNSVSHNNNELVGDPIEIALIDFAVNAGYHIDTIRKRHQGKIEFPFDTETKMMAAINLFDDHYRISVKGAIESLLNYCDKISVNGKEIEFNNKDQWLKQADQMASEGLRILGFAYRKENSLPDKDHLLEHLTFIGIIGFHDPPRSDVSEAISSCHQAGIKVVMVTGDHPGTALHIAKAVGLVNEKNNNEKVITGQDFLSQVTSDKKQILDTTVFARFTPSQKIKLVSFYQDSNFVVGMTGDGVNDAPALRKADIGIAMGVRGTEVAKEVSDVILRDDQFSSIELAISQGRIIFENIRKFVVYLLSSNMAEIISVTIAALVNLPLPLLPLQILYLNLVTDVFPALSLAMGEGEKDIMRQQPRSPLEPILPKSLWVSTFVYGMGITIAVIGISAFAHLYLRASPEVVNNMAFYTLVGGQLLNIFNLPKRNISFFNNEITRNNWVWLALLLCIILTISGYLILPLRNVLSLVPLSLSQLGYILVFSISSLIITQIIKRLGGTI